MAVRRELWPLIQVANVIGGQASLIVLGYPGLKVKLGMIELLSQLDDPG
jgi:hypothetical protein